MQRLSNAYERTVHGLTRAIENRVVTEDVFPAVIGALTVFGLGGPQPARQPGPTISLTVLGRVFTATRQHHGGRVVWAVDRRHDTDLLGLLVAEARRQLGREVAELEAVELALAAMRRKVSFAA